MQATRTVYFDYQQTSDPYFTYLQKVTYPGGCVSSYKLLGNSGDAATVGRLTAIKKEVDADGYTTYFDYSSTTDPKLIRRIVEPEGRITYYNYQTLRTAVTLIGRPSTYYKFDESTTRGYVPNVRRVEDALAGRTYFKYTNTDRIRMKLDQIGNITYYDYDAQNQITKVLTPNNNGSTQHSYLSGSAYDLKKTLGPRNSASYSVATYYEYNAQRMRTAVINPLNQTTTIGYNSNFGNMLKRLDARGNITYFHYSPALLLELTQDALNQTTYFGYDGWRNLRAMVSPRWVESSIGAFTTYHTYDSRDQRTKTTDPLGNSTNFSYTSRGDLFTTVDARGTTTETRYNGLRLNTRRLVTDVGATVVGLTYYGYDVYKNKIRQTDARGNSSYFDYDRLDRQITQTTPLAETTYYFYDAAGNRTKVRDARANTTYYFYNNLNKLAVQRTPLGESTYFYYDVALNQTTARNALANTTYFFYDKLDRVRGQRDALANLTYFTFDAVGNRTKVCDARTNTTYFFFDALNRQTSQRNAVGNATYFFYDAAGNRKRIRNPLANTTYYFYDKIDRPTVMRTALANATYFYYDSVGNRTKVRDARASTAYFAFDAMNRQRTMRDMLGNLTYYNYDLTGNQSSVIDARNNNSYFNYDALNRMSSAFNGARNATYYFYDRAGNRDGIRNGRGNRTYFGYDSLNRLSIRRNALDQTNNTFYDAVGNVSRIKNPLGNTSYFRYDAINRVTAVRDPLANAIYFGYDSNSNRTKEIDQRGNATYFTYDTVNRLTGITDPLLANATYVYDANSNLRKTLDNNRMPIYFAYDADNRRTGISFASGCKFYSYGVQDYGTTPYGGVPGTITNQTFTYDAVGNLTNMADETGTTDAGFDALNRLAKRRARGDTTYFEYNAVSALQRLQYPQGTAAYYRYDKANRLETYITPAGNVGYYQYDTASNVTALKFGNGARCTYSYDNAERVSMIRHRTSTGANIAYFIYDRDSAGRISHIDRDDDRTVYYAYDNADRLTWEIWRKRSTGATVYGFSYRYDATGNRLKGHRTAWGGSVIDTSYYSYNAANALTKRYVSTSATTTYYNYDLNGALTREVTGGASVDYLYWPNQLIARIVPSSGSACYFFYDGQLNRTRIVQGTTPTYYVWAGMNPLEARNGAGTLTARYAHGSPIVPGVGSIIQVQRATATTTYYQYLHMDHQGSVQKVTDVNQATQISYVNDAFGRQIVSPGGANPAVPNDFQFQSNWFTLTVSSKRYGISPTRVWDSDVGTFISRDPYVPFDIDRNSPSKYSAAFVPNDVDPTGLKVTYIILNENTDHENDDIYEIAEKQQAKVTATRWLLRSIGREKFQKMIDDGKVKFNKVVFKGSAAEYMRMTQRELITIIDLTGFHGTVQEIADIQKESASTNTKPWDATVTFAHSDLNNPGFTKPVGGQTIESMKLKQALTNAKEGMHCLTCLLGDENYKLYVRAGIYPGDFGTIPAKTDTVDEICGFWFDPPTASEFRKAQNAAGDASPEIELPLGTDLSGKNLPPKAKTKK